MNRISTLFFALIILIVSQGCEKTAPILKPTYHALEDGSASLSATVGDTSFLWRTKYFYGKYGYRSRIGSNFSLGGIGQKTVSVYCELTSTKDLKTGFSISTPYHTEGSDELIMEVLKVGEKQIGSVYNPFIITITTGGKTYTSQTEQPNGSLSVEYSKLSYGYGKTIAYAKFKVNCRLYNEATDTFIYLKNGEITADFEYKY